MESVDLNFFFFFNLVHRLQAKVTGFVEKPKYDLFREISELKIY